MTNIEKAQELRGNNDFTMRSCWECNSGHKHLKEVGGLFVCFECGKWYMNGDYLTENEEHCNAKFKEKEPLKIHRITLTPNNN